MHGIYSLIIVFALLHAARPRPMIGKVRIAFLLLSGLALAMAVLFALGLYPLLADKWHHFMLTVIRMGGFAL
ncbi:hypothetical protein [Paenibacillus humicola]|uniref:hypothetical protein n=1 Tax=Paenibacillus humicola TaxID=3110540 RepID=UPI00237A4D43|nr:hypothetical protein [Paenibacillus humicola]